MGKDGEWSYSKPRISTKFPDFQGTYQQLALIITFSTPEKQRVQKQAWHNSRINASNY
jgi:hypothetical protein